MWTLGVLITIWGNLQQLYQYINEHTHGVVFVRVDDSANSQHQAVTTKLPNNTTSGCCACHSTQAVCKRLNDCMSKRLDTIMEVVPEQRSKVDRFMDLGQLTKFPKVSYLWSFPFKFLISSINLFPQHDIRVLR